MTTKTKAPRLCVGDSSLGSRAKDTGGQYRDGTTDVTRTVHFGTPTEVRRMAMVLFAGAP